MIRVVVGEDNALLREGIVALLDAAPDIDVVGAGADLPELEVAVAEGRLSAEGAFAAAQVDELYQIDRWGDDPLALKHREGIAKDIDAGTRFLALLEKARLRG